MPESTECDLEKRPINPPASEAIVSSCDHQAISFISDLWIVVSIVTFIADVGSDLWVCVQHYNQNHFWYFGITLGLVVAASLVLQLFSAKWFYDDGKKACRVYVLHFVQMGPLLRYWSAIRLCWQSRNGRIPLANELVIPKWRDLCMLRLLQAFIQSAPQAVFQLVLLCRKATFVLEDDLIVVISAIMSIITVIWSLVCYSKALRDLRENAQDLPWLGFAFQVSWRGCMLTSRIVALVLFASHFQQWMILAAAGHWLLMALWLTCQRTQFCVDEHGRAHPWKEKLFNSLIAFIYIFCFFNTKEGMTRKRIVLFYSVMLVENSLLISMWYPNRTLNAPMTYAALGVVWGGFVLGIIFMILYYRLYHHSHPFKGLFLRTRTFNLQGRKMYGLYFCCCFRVKKWDVAIYDCRESNAESSLVMRQDQDRQVGDPQALDRDGDPQGANLHWDNDDIQIRPLNGSCARGRDDDPHKAVLVQRQLVRGFSRDEDPDAVPDIIVTAASPLAVTPRVSLCLLSSEDQDITPEGDHTTRDEGQDRPPLSPGQTSLDKAREILASKLIKGAKSHDDEERDVEEDDIPKINYGTVSFGNRYSLVSSDCISISSESSLSSFTNSLNDLLDRMGLASKNETAKDLKISGGADEGIFSDERYSPSKSCDKDSEPSPSRELEIQQHTKTVNGDAYEKTTPNKPPFHDDSFNYLESLMDAPSSPYAKKRSPKSQVKDEESESESTDASSDDRDRRYSCEEFFSPNRPSSPQEDKAKRHSFDIADLSANYNRAKKKGRRNRRFNQIIIFDNFVASPLKPGKFGSLRKSFERLSKIQEVTEELGLLSNESLKDIPEPQFGDPSSLGNQAVQNIAEKPRFHDVCLATADHRYPNTNNSVDNRTLQNSSNGRVELNPVEQTNIFSPLSEIIIKTPKSEPLDEILLINDKNEEELENEHTNNKKEELLQDNELKNEHTPSRFSTVRRSLESVPLACCEDFDDLDDLGSYSDDINTVGDCDKPPALVSPSSDRKVPLQRNVSTDSIADSDSSRELVPNDSTNRSLASSGSSIFENFLFLETGQNPSGAQLNKRHTFAFGANRIDNARREKVKRLGTSCSHYTLRNPGSPVWVRKAVFAHRRRKTKVIAHQNNSDDSVGYIQEIRV